MSLCHLFELIQLLAYPDKGLLIIWFPNDARTVPLSRLWANYNLLFGNTRL
jgi:hypothetical protein